jgi:hypothetical protein
MDFGAFVDLLRAHLHIVQGHTLLDDLRGGNDQMYPSQNKTAGIALTPANKPKTHVVVLQPAAFKMNPARKGPTTSPAPQAVLNSAYASKYEFCLG